MEELQALDFTSKIVPVKPINDETTLCKCYTLALGKNANKSYISKEACDDALPTLYNIPVVGHIRTEDGEEYMGGHDVEIKKNGNGSYRIKTLTVPYGVVPNQDDVHYEDVDVNGKTETYLVCDIILWTGRYPQLLETKYDEEIYFNQSMEVKVLEGSKTNDGYLDFKKFRFSALCLLGKSDDDNKNVVPCFPAARVEPYQFALEESKELFEEFQSKLNEIYSQQNFGKGGKEEMNSEQINAILAEFNIKSVDELTFEIDADMTEEQLREKLAAYAEEAVEEPVEAPVEEAVEEEVVVEEATEEQEKKPAAFELSYKQKYEKICAALNDMCVMNEVEYKDYWLCDFDTKYVYTNYYEATAETSNEGNARFEYVESDGAVIINKESFTNIYAMWLTKEEADKLNADRSELAELKQYKSKREEEDRNAAYAKVIEKFSDLSDVEEYKALVSNAMDIDSVETLEEKLFAIRGRFGKFENKKSSDTVFIPVANKNSNEDESLESRFFSKYLPEAIKQK